MVEDHLDLLFVTHACSGLQWRGGLPGVAVVHYVPFETVNIKDVVDLPTGRDIREFKSIFLVLFFQHVGAREMGL
jgi:hypothetical protein